MFADLTRDDVFRLETARLWLRWPRLADAQTIARLAGDKAVAAMTAVIPHPYPHGEAERFVFEARKGNATGEALVLAITAKGRDAPIGIVSLNPARGPFEDPCDLELGYWIGEPFRGEGHAPEAVAAIVDAGFSLSGISAICASARVVNAASRRVIEKAGFAHVGSCLKAFPARGGAFAVDRFTLTREDWRQMREVAAVKAPARRARPALQAPTREPASDGARDWSGGFACA